MTKTYQQRTYEQRCQISALKKRGSSQREIAEIIGTSQSTVSRELASNTGKKGYRHKQSKTTSDQRRISAVKSTKMTAELIAFVESKLRLEWSSEPISSWLLEVREQLLSHETIYLYIWANKKEGGDLYTCLRR
jgi:IS30 family transposase